MADLSTLARPYAKAAFELARDEGRYAQWSAALAALAATVSAPELDALIGHPALRKADLANALGRALLPDLGEQGTSLVRLLVDNGRVRAAPHIAEQFEALRGEAESRVDVQITTAAAVSGAGQEKLADAIGKRLAREVVVSWNTDESLVAGAVIRAGDLVIDGSVRGELEKLKTALAA